MPCNGGYVLRTHVRICYVCAPNSVICGTTSAPSNATLATNRGLEPKVPNQSVSPPP